MSLQMVTPGHGADRPYCRFVRERNRVHFTMINDSFMSVIIALAF